MERLAHNRQLVRRRDHHHRRRSRGLARHLSLIHISQRVAIASAKLPATLQYQSTPALREAAFLTALANNNTEYPFLAGTLNTFLDDAFVAASSMKSVMPGEKMELALRCV